MAASVKLDRYDHSKVQSGSGAPGTSTPGNIYIDTVDGSLYVKSNSTWATISGGGGALQVSYDLGNTIAVANTTPVLISCVDTAGSILLSLENNDATNDLHCMTIANNVNSAANIYTDAHSINLSGSNPWHQIVNTVGTGNTYFNVYSYLLGGVAGGGAGHEATFGVREVSVGVSRSGATYLTSYFQTYTDAVCGGETYDSDISSYFRSYYDDSVNGPDANVATHTYLSSIGSGGLSDIWIEANSGTAQIYIYADASATLGGGDDAFIEVQSAASIGQATLNLKSIGDVAYTGLNSEGDSDAATYIDSICSAGVGYIAIGTQASASIDVTASGSGSVLNLSSDSDSAFNYVHLWAYNSDNAPSSEVRIGANSDFSAHTGIITFCDDNLIADGSLGNFAYLSSSTGDWYNFYAAYGASSLVGGLAKATTDIPVNIPIVGTHTGADDAAVLTDATKAWVADALIGRTIANTTDGSSTAITDNDATTVTGVLGGGAGNEWDTGDAYTITTETIQYSKSGQMYTNEAATADITLNLPAAAANRNFQFYVKTNKYLKIQAGAGDVISIAGTSTAAAGYIRSTTIGNAIKLVAINATDWVAVSVVGVWSLDS